MKNKEKNVFSKESSSDSSSDLDYSKNKIKKVLATVMRKTEGYDKYTNLLRHGVLIRTDFRQGVDPHEI